MASSGEVDLVMLDVRMPVADGMSVLDELMERVPGLPVVMMTAYGDVEMAVDAMKRGAADFLLKPLDITRLKGLVTRLLESGARPPEPSGEEPSEFVGRSVAARKVRELARVAARSNAGILLTGESGTGKEVISSAIHRMGPRSAGPFVAINCAAVPPQLLESELFGHEKGAFTDAVSTEIGKFEAAHGGSILLDEISEMDNAMQTKLLRVLQDHSIVRVGSTTPIEVDVRVIAATNRDPEEAIAQGVFREDLYYRLNVLNIPIPPLRERPEDIVVLAGHFLDLHGDGTPKRLARTTESILKSYYWPGNARELENTIERALLFATGSDILPEHLPPQLVGELPKPVETGVRPGWSLQEVERDLIVKTLELNSGNRTRAAEALGMSRRALQMKIKKFDLD